jgi:hypothetical protein
MGGKTHRLCRQTAGISLVRNRLDAPHQRLTEASLAADLGRGRPDGHHRPITFVHEISAQRIGKPRHVVSAIGGLALSNWAFGRAWLALDPWREALARFGPRHAWRESIFCSYEARSARRDCASARGHLDAIAPAVLPEIWWRPCRALRRPLHGLAMPLKFADSSLHAQEPQRQQCFSISIRPRSPT